MNELNEIKVFHVYIFFVPYMNVESFPLFKCAVYLQFVFVCMGINPNQTMGGTVVFLLVRRQPRKSRKSEKS